MRVGGVFDAGVDDDWVVGVDDWVVGLVGLEGDAGAVGAAGRGPLVGFSTCWCSVRPSTERTVTMN